MDNLANVTVDCMTVDFHGRPSSIARFMQGKSQVMDGFNEDVCIKFNTSNWINNIDSFYIH